MELPVQVFRVGYAEYHSVEAALKGSGRTDRPTLWCADESMDEAAAIAPSEAKEKPQKSRGVQGSPAARLSTDGAASAPATEQNPPGGVSAAET